MAWITGDVDLPQVVMDAHAEGRLVLFVGAGASVAAPSSLPLFGELARQLAELARVSFDDAMAIDFFLGSMPTNFDTHAHARDLIAREGSMPNSTHIALVRVASAIGPLRIVTTNFDDHLSSAATADGIEVDDKWIGPALPLGDDFAGIVHLHGSVLRDARELVLTDRDFGQAYLTQAWATRFLLSMFQEFTVLFVGYSHDDPIMRYLALGLPSRTLRYAFIGSDSATDTKWTRLGVTPIGYPVQDNDHTALVAALEAWDVRARMGQTDHRARMKEIVHAGPTLTPIDRDYVLERLMTVDGTGEFTSATEDVDSGRRVEWLRWVEDLPEFKSLFAGIDGGDPASILGNWFCETFVRSPELHGAALQTVQRLGQKFASGLFNAARWAAEGLSREDAVAGRRWKAFLATSIHGQSAPVDVATMLADVPADHSEDMSVLRAALRPFLTLRRRWVLDAREDATGIPDAEANWNVETETLTRHVLKVVELEAAGDLVLGAVLEDSLSAAYDLIDAYHDDRGWDRMSFARSAIEPHEQDQLRDRVNAVIDGLRAFGEKALHSHPGLPERWWSLERALFRRLALHLLCADESRTSDEKIAWLLDQSVLYETTFKYEVYRVLQRSIRAASAEVRVRLLEATLAGPSLPEGTPDPDRHTAYGTYNLLVWLISSAPDWIEASDAFTALQAANPGFAPREHPDFDSWMTSGVWGGTLPAEPDDFAQALAEDVDGAFDDLMNRDYSEREFAQLGWSDALALISRVAESHPQLGNEIWTLTKTRTDLDTKAEDLRQAIIEGWAKADLGDLTDAAIAQVATQLTNPESARSVSRFLLEQVRAHIDSDETPALAAMRVIALELWREQGHSFTHSEGVDPVSGAPLYLNSWPGELARYWMSEVDRRWRKNRDDWSGLSEEERNALTELLQGPPAALDATQPALASELFFLFAADPEFSSAHVLPLLREDETARLAWHSYLHHPRYNDKLLAASLLESAIAEWGRLDVLGHLQNQFFRLVGSIVSFAGIPAEGRQALLDQSVLAADGKHAAAFAEAVVHLLRADNVDGAEVWNRWLRNHLASRLRGVPRIAEGEELARWADAVPYLGSATTAALNVFSGRGIGLGDRFLNPDFPEGVLDEIGPALVQHYSERVQISSPNGYIVPYQVAELIETIRSAVGDSVVKPLVDAAAERGFIGRGTS